MKIHPIFQTWDCTHKRVFLRADLNVPLKNTTILSDARLKAIQPTLNALLAKDAIVILATHIGNPKNKESHLSTQLLMPWFEKQGYHIQYISDLSTASTLSRSSTAKTILLLENVRFYKGEKDHSIAFAKELAQLADFYINDAFGTLHRNDTSITLLAEQFPFEKRSIGLLVAQELQILNALLKKPAHPFILILGGSKLETKIPVIENLLSLIDAVILLPAIVFTFMKAQGISVGKSLVDDSLLEKCSHILKETDKIIFPIDFQVAENSVDGPLSITKKIMPHQIGISTGPKSLTIYKDYIQKAGTILFNGPMGFMEKPKTTIYTKELLEEIRKSSGTSVVAGGDSVGFVEQYAIKGIDNLIVGGGSALYFLAGLELPGLVPFLKDRAKSN